jgi:hypothetical protein
MYSSGLVFACKNFADLPFQAHCSLKFGKELANEYVPKYLLQEFADIHANVVANYRKSAIFEETV